MARARNIKPGFFKNELLVELPAFDRLLFIGLWCLADREGRIEDRPKRIKIELFPCDDYSVDEGLDALASAGFISRYEADGKRVVAITNFLKHQTPHGTEKDSDLPDEHGNYTVHERNANGCVAGAKRQSNRAATKEDREPNEEITLNNVEPQCKNALNPDSLNPESTTSEANASGGKPPVETPSASNAPATQILSADEVIFTHGLALLTTAGTPERQARSFLGGLRKQHGDDVLIAKLRECYRLKPLQPLEWLGAALPPQSRAGPASPRNSKQAALEARNAEVAANWVPPELRDQQQGEVIDAHE